MIPYFLCFALSSGFTGFASYFKRRKSKLLFIVLSCLALFLPCFLAGVRDDTIGTDMLVYGNKVFKDALSMDFISYMQKDMEPLFLLLVRFISYFTNSIAIYYFVLELAVILPIYCTLQREKGNKYAWVAMMVYYLLLFPYSFNLLRQSIAVSIIFFAFKYVQKHQLLKYIIALIIAMLFHKTAIIGLIIYPIYVLMTENNNNLSKIKQKNELLKFTQKHSTAISCIVIFISFGCVTLMEQVINFFYNLDNSAYAYFYNKIDTSNSLVSVLIFLILLSPIYIIYLLNRRYYMKKDLDINILFTFSLMGIIMYQARMVSSEMYRVSLYLYIFLPLFVENVIRLKKNPKTRFLYILIILVLCVAFFCFFFVKSKWNKIYPYTSSMIGIL